MNTLSIYNIQPRSQIHSVYNLGMKEFPNNIRYYRELRGMSQEALGKAIGGRTKDTISKWERGERKLKMEEAKKLSSVLGVTLGQIGGEIEETSYQADEDLMQLAAESIQKAALAQKRRLSLAEAMTYTVMLYNHIIPFRKQNKNIIPDEAIASLIIKNAANN